MNLQEYTIEIYKHYKFYDIPNVDDVLEKYFNDISSYIQPGIPEFCDYNYLYAKYLFNKNEYVLAKNYILASLMSFNNGHYVSLQEIVALWVDIIGHLNEKNQVLKIFDTFNWDFTDHEVFVRVTYWMTQYQYPNNTYIFTLYNNLKIKFNGSQLVTNNYSEAMQDMFVLSVLNGKRNGTYLELGSAEYNINNNTYLLESIFSWRGISIELNSDLVKEFNKNRKNICIYADALKLDYEYLIKERLDTNRVDYLQVDLDPASTTLQALEKVIESNIRFSIITFEHDIYNTNGDEKYKAKELLESKGYVLAIPNVCSKHIKTQFEDWYIDSQIIDDYIQNVINTLVDDKYNGVVNEFFYITS